MRHLTSLLRMWLGDYILPELCHLSHFFYAKRCWLLITNTKYCRPFLIPEKYRHSLVCIYRLCRFFLFCGGCRNQWVKFANAVINDFDTLYSSAINTLCLVNIY